MKIKKNETSHTKGPILPSTPSQHRDSTHTRTHARTRARTLQYRSLAYIKKKLILVFIYKL